METSYLNYCLRHVEATKAKEAGFTADPEHYYFRVACSCPPDKRLHMRGGLMYDHQSYDGWFVESTTIDLTDTSQVSAAFTFNTADYYMGYYMRLTSGGGSTPYTFGFVNSGNEFATAGEAEQDLIAYAEGGFAWGASYPLCGVILHNDGNAGVSKAFLPIDPINRGRSYLWPRDWRPRNIAL